MPVADRKSIHELIAVADAQALAELLQDVPVRLDLIAVTDHRGIYALPTPQEITNLSRCAKRLSHATRRTALLGWERYSCGL